MSHHLIVGDVHGCFDRFECLLQAIRFSVRQHHVCFLGDIVNRGSQSEDMLDWCLRYRDNISLVLGNHDIYFLALAFDVVKDTSGHKHIMSLLSHSRAGEWIDWLKCQPFFMVKEEKFALVHAGLWSTWDYKKSTDISKRLSDTLCKDPKSFLQETWGNQVSEQSYREKDVCKTDNSQFFLNVLTRIRAINDQGHLDLLYKSAYPPTADMLTAWFDIPHASWLRDTLTCPLFFGHWSALGLGIFSERKKIRCLDTGAIWGGGLSGYMFEEHKIIQV